MIANVAGCELRGQDIFFPKLCQDLVPEEKICSLEGGGVVGNKWEGDNNI